MERIKKLKDLASPSRLKQIRDKIHFHIDKEAVIDTKRVWRDANITPQEVWDAFLNMIYILQPLYKEEFADVFPMDFNENEAKRIAKFAKDLIE